MPMAEESGHGGKASASTCRFPTHAPSKLDLTARPLTCKPSRSRQRALMLRLLVQLRNDAALDQATLAHQLDITQSEVSKYERGERNLDVLRLREWLQALEIELLDFINALDQQLILSCVQKSRSDPLESGHGLGE
jgi:ribosome-binding protein aMBF1 (putative translation factor)